jgi:hypothetical protein
MIRSCQVSVGRNKRSALRRKRSLLHAASAAYLRRLITSTAAEAAVSARRSPFAREGAMRCAYCALRPCQSTASSPLFVRFTVWIDSGEDRQLHVGTTQHIDFVGEMFLDDVRRAPSPLTAAYPQIAAVLGRCRPSWATTGLPFDSYYRANYNCTNQRRKEISHKGGNWSCDGHWTGEAFCDIHVCLADRC